MWSVLEGKSCRLCSEMYFTSDSKKAALTLWLLCLLLTCWRKLFPIQGRVGVDPIQYVLVITCCLLEQGRGVWTTCWI